MISRRPGSTDHCGPSPGRPGSSSDRRLVALSVATAIAAAMAITLGVIAAGRGALGPDDDAFAVAGDLRTGGTVRIARALTDLGALPSAVALVVAVGAWSWWRRRHGAAAALTGGLVLAVLAVHYGKAITARARPAGGLEATSGLSYPSGHTTYAMAWVACALVVAGAVTSRRRRAALLGGAAAIALVIGATRVFLRSHYLTDVIGGACTGAAAFGLVGAVALIAGRVRHNDPAP